MGRRNEALNSRDQSNRDSLPYPQRGLHHMRNERPTETITHSPGFSTDRDILRDSASALEVAARIRSQAERRQEVHGREERQRTREVSKRPLENPSSSREHGRPPKKGRLSSSRNSPRQPSHLEDDDANSAQSRARLSEPSHPGDADKAVGEPDASGEGGATRHDKALGNDALDEVGREQPSDAPKATKTGPVGLDGEQNKHIASGKASVGKGKQGRSVRPNAVNSAHGQELKSDWKTVEHPLEEAMENGLRADPAKQLNQKVKNGSSDKKEVEAAPADDASYNVAIGKDMPTKLSAGEEQDLIEDDKLETVDAGAEVDDGDDGEDAVVVRKPRARPSAAGGSTHRRNRKLQAEHAPSQKATKSSNMRQPQKATESNTIQPQKAAKSLNVRQPLSWEERNRDVGSGKWTLEADRVLAAQLADRKNAGRIGKFHRKCFPTRSVGDCVRRRDRLVDEGRVEVERVYNNDRYTIVDESLRSKSASED